jgi:hypothetical protein
MNIVASRLLTLGLAFASIAIPAAAGTIAIVDGFDPNGLQTNSPNGAFVNLPNGISADGMSWNGVGAVAFNVSGNSDLSFSGMFTCASVCDDTFEIDFTGTGFNPGTTSYVSLVGSGVPDFISVQALSSNNQTFGYVSYPSLNITVLQTIQAIGNSSVFNVASSPVVINNAGDFSGELFFNLQMEAGTINVPPLSSADLIITNGASVPEPGSLAIAAACLILFLYVKRLRKA